MALRHDTRALRGRTRAFPGSRHEASSLPALPAVSATATACQGRGRDGRVPFLWAPAARGGEASAGLGGQFGDGLQQQVEIDRLGQVAADFEVLGGAGVARVLVGADY